MALAFASVGMLMSELGLSCKPSLLATAAGLGLALAGASSVWAGLGNVSAKLVATELVPMELAVPTSAAGGLADSAKVVGAVVNSGKATGDTTSLLLVKSVVTDADCSTWKYQTTKTSDRTIAAYLNQGLLFFTNCTCGIEVCTLRLVGVLSGTR